MEKNTLIHLKNKIEELDKIHHPKILQVLINNKIKYSENRNGVFINMNSINKETIDKINVTLLYISEQEKTINDIESIKDDLNNNFFKNNNYKDNKDYVHSKYNTNEKNATEQ